MTIVGFGTSTPELLVSVQAALAGSGGIAAGNVVGSNIANVLLILGVAALIGPVATRFAMVRADLAWMLAASFGCVAVFWDGHAGRIEGMLLFAAMLAYILQALRSVGSAPPAAGTTVPPVWRSVAMTLGGLVALMVGARLMVDSATEFARVLGVSEAVIGLTVVAVGTSLPEMAATVAAAARGARDIALGNVIGSNIFNVLGILGLTALIAPVPVDARFMAFDVPVMIAAAVVMALILWRSGSLGRIWGAAFVAAYTAYTVSMAVT
jgi:cation:H+ antiporter